MMNSTKDELKKSDLLLSVFLDKLVNLPGLVVQVLAGTTFPSHSHP